MTYRLTAFTPAGDRIMAIIEHYGLRKSTFSQRLGMRDNSLIVRIVNDPGRSFTIDLLQRIALNFPDVNIRWLITGEGEMLTGKSTFPDPKLHYIKYYHKDSREPDDYLRIAGYDDCDSAFDVYGDIMAPRMRTGDIIICKSLEVSDLVRYGEAYMIITKNVPLYRYIRNEVDPETIKLGAEDSRYEDTTLRKTDIQGLYIIKGVVKREAF